MKHVRIGISSMLVLAALVQSISLAVAATPPAGYEDDVKIKPPSRNWFSDLDPNSRIGIAANYLADNGIVGGFPDGTFRARRLVNRAELAKFITNADKTCHVDPNARNNGRFSDVLDGEWYVPFVMAAAKCEIIYGNPDGTFSPERSVNTAEMLAMIARANFGLQTDVDHTYSDVQTDMWFDEYAGVAQEKQLFPERDQQLLDPSRPLTRGEVAYVLYLILSENDEDSADLHLKVYHEKTTTPGGRLKYVVSLRNLGPDTSDNTVVIFSSRSVLLRFNEEESDGRCKNMIIKPTPLPLPKPLNSSSHESDVIIQPYFSNRVLCDFGDVGPKALVTASLVFDVYSETSCRSTISALFESDSHTNDPNARNNNVQTKTEVVCDHARADLSLNKPVPYPASGNGGERIVIKQIVANAGPDKATNVVFTSNVPEGMSFDYDGSNPPFCSSEDNRTVTCRDFPLSTPFKLSFVVRGDTHCGETFYKAHVAADQIDPIPANNSRTAKITINCDRLEDQG